MKKSKKDNEQRKQLKETGSIRSNKEKHGHKRKEKEKQKPNGKSSSEAAALKPLEKDRAHRDGDKGSKIKKLIKLSLKHALESSSTDSGEGDETCSRNPIPTVTVDAVKYAFYTSFFL